MRNLRWLALSVVIVALAGNARGQGCPITPVLSSPANGATNVSRFATLSWSNSGAMRYDIFLTKISEGGCNAAHPSGSSFNTTFNPPQLEAGTQYAWRVVATKDPCPIMTSSCFTFTTAAAQQPNTCPVAPVTLTSPQNGATGVVSPVTFRWNAVTNAKSYTVLASVDNGSFERYGTTSETSLQTVVAAGTIRWLVVATADNCAEVRSAVSTFTAVRPTCGDASITLRAPANGSSPSAPVKFEWTAVNDATAYRLYVSVAGSPSEIVARTTAPEATVNLTAGAAVWQVEALRGTCPSVLSPRGLFTVAAATTCASNAIPTLISPIGTRQNPVAVTSPVTLKWNAVPNAIAYRVWAAREGQPFSDIALTKNTEIQRPVDEDGIYSWFLEALFNGCPPTRSALGYFQITTERCGAAAPTIMTPAGGSTSTAPVTFTWGAVPNAKEYRVIASFNTGQTFVLGTTTDTTLTRVIPPGTVAYSIEAVFDECPSTFSVRTTFTIPESQNCPTAPPGLVSPTNGATNVTLPVTLSWSSIPNAVRYVVMVRFNDGAPTPAGETTSTQLTLRTLPGGRFEWWVLAFVTGCRPLESTHFTFSTSDPANCADNRRPLIFEPSNGAVILATQVDFDWSDVPRATSYKLWAAKGEDAPAVIATTQVSRATVDVPVGGIRFFIEAVFEGCPSTHSAPAFFIATSQAPECRTPRTPRANVVGQAVSGTEYNLRWTPLSNVDLFEVQEATASDFSNATTQTVDGISAAFKHTVDTPTRYYYRVRGISNCSDERGEFSDFVSTLVSPPRTSGTSRNASAEIGVAGTIVQTHFVPGAGAGASFTATVDKRWLTVQPASGALPPEGITLNVIADPSVLAFGTNTATVSVVVTTPTFEGIATHGTTSSTLPFSISLVTPVTPVGKSAPPPDALIIAAVAHTVGVEGSQFESDIRLTNLGATTAKYQLNFTQSGVDGTTTGTSSTIEVAPNETTALDDVLASLFGTGTSNIIGMLEIRPLTSSTSSTSFVTSSSGVLPVSTVASSRTYNNTPTGTFGQYIPALPYAQFAGKGTILSLQQIAESAAYRTNFGFAEASGQPADLVVRVYDTAGTLIASIPQSLKASEHKQIGSMLAANGITNLQNGRVEVEVLSTLGKVTAYASTVDNITSDPLLVSPTVASTVSANRYVIPGVALLNNGIADWRTDLRVFNGGAADTAATLTFYPQGNPGAPMVKETTVKAREILVLDNILANTFGLTSSPGGSVIVSTPGNTSVVATARTYNQTTAGTYGQFVPGVTPSQATGLGERSLQLLQLEHSTRFRTNIGLAETTGNPARVEVSLSLPDSKATPVLAFDLAPNEFRQISMADFGSGSALYNIRATVKVVSGTGRVTAYGSAIDMLTQDPTYVPAQ